jgi:hypothetical protein
MYAKKIKESSKEIHYLIKMKTKERFSIYFAFFHIYKFTYAYDAKYTPSYDRFYLIL